jgi:hypothetical protein
MNTPELVNGRPDSPYYNNQLDAVTVDNGDGTYSLSVTTTNMNPTLQQVTDASGSPATTTGNIFANRLSIKDEANAQEVVIKAIDYHIQFQQSGAGFGFEYSNALDGQLTIKNNPGAILTDASVRVQIPNISVSGGSTSFQFSHGYDLTPNAVIVQAQNSQARNFFATGFNVNWNNTIVEVSINTPSLDDTDSMDFLMLFYFIP